MENFVCNKKNLFALEIAYEITKKQKEPGYNPLMYYGKSGSGKTHLLRAIANESSIIYDYHSIFYGNIEGLFHSIDKKYNMYCIDDIHYFINNIQLQEKFVAFLDACLPAKKQLVCACSEFFFSNKGFSEILRSRIESGRIIEIKNPDLDVRMRFIKNQCIIYNINITHEDILLLAQRYEHLHSISSVLQKLVIYKKTMQRDATKQYIKKNIHHSNKHGSLTPRDIIHQVGEYFSLPPEEIMGSKRKPDIVFARQTAMYLCREILGISYPALGKFFFGKDHSTIIYSIKKIEKYIVTNKDTYNEITKIKNRCSNINSESYHDNFVRKQH